MNSFRAIKNLFNTNSNLLIKNLCTKLLGTNILVNKLLWGQIHRKAKKQRKKHLDNPNRTNIFIAFIRSKHSLLEWRHVCW